MVHRIISMYRHDRRILLGLLSILGLFFVACIIVTGLTGQIVNVPVWFNPTFRSCIPTTLGVWAPTIWFLTMGFDLVVFALSAREGLRFLRDQAPLRRASREDILSGTGWSREGTVLRILFRDSIMFPFMSVLISIINIIAFYKLPAGSVHYTANIAGMSSPILGCRLILNLRDAYYQPFADEFYNSTKHDSPPAHEGFEMASMPPTPEVPRSPSRISIITARDTGRSSPTFPINQG
ncbi:hypothetical protein H1R20_g4071, partial [Candolleomyces eurysporus]